MNKYTAANKDINLLDSNERAWVSSILSNLISAYRDGGNREKAYRYMLEYDDLQKKLGIKDTHGGGLC